jgi:hypothetical protein
MQLKRWHAFLVWLVGTLAAIAVVGDSPVGGLAVAVASGIAFGLVNWWAARKGLT